MNTKAKRIIALVHPDGMITTEHGWYLGKLADLLDYDQLDKEVEEADENLTNND